MQTAERIPNDESRRQHYCSVLDSMYPPVIQSWLLCFPCAERHRLYKLKALQRSLTRTVQERPFLAGSLVRECEGPMEGRMKLMYPAEGSIDIRIVVNEMTQQIHQDKYSYDDLRKRGMPVDELDPVILEPSGGHRGLDESIIAVQANFVPNGCLLCVCINHSFADATGACAIFGAWAENCRREQLNMSPDVIPASREPVALSHIDTPQILQDGDGIGTMIHEELISNNALWQLLGLRRELSSSVAATVKSPSTTTRVHAVFSASTDSVARLKSAANPVAAKGEVSSGLDFVSSFDSVAALLWRCIIRARQDVIVNFPHGTTRLRTPMSLRRNLEIAPEYPGNVFMNSLTEMDIYELISDTTPIAQIASRVRRSLIWSRHAARISDAIKLASILPAPGRHRPIFADTTKEDLVVNSLENIPLYEHDWGSAIGPSGRFDFIRFSKGRMRGVCCLLPRLVRGGSLEVQLNLEGEQMERLKSDTEFLRYFQPQAS